MGFWSAFGIDQGRVLHRRIRRRNQDGDHTLKGLGRRTGPADLRWRPCPLRGRMEDDRLDDRRVHFQRGGPEDKPGHGQLQEQPERPEARNELAFQPLFDYQRQPYEYQCDADEEKRIVGFWRLLWDLGL